VIRNMAILILRLVRMHALRQFRAGALIVRNWLIRQEIWEL
jgi:hypothetical protein